MVESGRKAEQGLKCQSVSCTFPDTCSRWGPLRNKTTQKIILLWTNIFLWVDFLFGFLASFKKVTLKNRQKRIIFGENTFLCVHYGFSIFYKVNATNHAENNFPWDKYIFCRFHFYVFFNLDVEKKTGRKESSLLGQIVPFVISPFCVSFLIAVISFSC